MGLARLGKLPLKVLPRTSVAEAVRSMVERKVGALVVMEGPNLLGVFTERDLMTRVVAPGKEGGITLAVEKTEGYKGEVVKTATVVTNDPDQQQFVLTLRAMFASE